MKTFLFFLVLILAGLLFILNWGQKDEIISKVKNKFCKEQVQCHANNAYQEGKEWMKEKLDEI